jgi:hypothetical protein
MKGNIYYHPAFQFHDFGTAPKLLILLNEPAKREPYLIAKTTSQLAERTTYIQGCNEKCGVFYIDANADGQFTKPTLVTVNDVYEFSEEEFTTDARLELKATLSTLTMAQIINCLKRFKDDISVKHFELLTK